MTRLQLDADGMHNRRQSRAAPINAAQGGGRAAAAIPHPGRTPGARAAKTARASGAGSHLFGVYDRDGNIIFRNSEQAQTEIVETYHQKEIDRDLPRTTRFTFDHDGKHIVYTLDVLDEIEFRDMYGQGTPEARAHYDDVGAKTIYARYFANGTFEITEGGRTATCTGTMLYEYTEQ